MLNLIIALAVDISSGSEFAVFEGRDHRLVINWHRHNAILAQKGLQSGPSAQVLLNRLDSEPPSIKEWSDANMCGFSTEGITLISFRIKIDRAVYNGNEFRFGSANKYTHKVSVFSNDHIKLYEYSIDEQRGVKEIVYFGNNRNKIIEHLKLTNGRAPLASCNPSK